MVRVACAPVSSATLPCTGPAASPQSWHDARQMDRIVATLLALCAGVTRLVKSASSSSSSNVDISASDRSELADLAAKLYASSELTYTAG